MSWQPISSAPTNKPVIVLYWDSNGQQHQIQAKWDSELRGWLSTSCDCVLYKNVTHWMEVLRMLPTDELKKTLVDVKHEFVPVVGKKFRCKPKQWFLDNGYKQIGNFLKAPSGTIGETAFPIECLNGINEVTEPAYSLGLEFGGKYGDNHYTYRIEWCEDL